MIVAIDGPAASGKGTLARRLADTLDLAYLDTGSLYRAVGLAVLRSGGDPAAEADGVAAAKALDISKFLPEDLRSEQAGEAASQVASIQAVRAALLEFQRRFAHQPPGGKAGVVMDGRDIGTVVCPDATVKLFVTASLEIRAERRLKELQEQGRDSIKARVLQDMRERDARDQQRAQSPLKRAEDAHIVDTSGLDADLAFNHALSLVERTRR